MVSYRSNGIYRSVVVAVAGLALAGAQQPAKQSQTTSGPQQAQAAPKPAAPPAKTAEPPYRPYSERYSDSCYTAENHDSADLCAQWRAAIAAEKAAKEARIATIAAIIGTVLSLATVIGLIITIYQTRGALAEARRGNRLNLLFEKRSRRESRKDGEVQAEALRIAQRNAESASAALSRDRAWVMFAGLPFMFANNTDFGNGTYGDTVICQITWRNSGQTPAINDRQYTARIFCPVEDYIKASADFANVVLPFDDSDATSVVGPGAEFGSAIITLSQEQFNGFSSGKQAILIRGEVRYFDIYNPAIERVTQFQLAAFYRGGSRSDGSVPVSFVHIGKNTAT